MQFFVIAVGILSGLAVICQAQDGRIVRPKDDEVTEVAPIEVRSCPHDEWDSVKSIREYSNWTAATLPDVEGFTVMLTQWRTTVNSRCFGTTITKLEGDKLSIVNVYPTQESNSVIFNLGEPEALSVNASEVEESTKQLMIAGASPNFIAYATCNGNSSHVNLFVTYKHSIEEAEKKAINKWLKLSNLPLLGPWAAINFDTCSLTKTYVCSGGQETFCSTIRRHPKSSSKKDSSEDTDEYFDLFWMW